MLRRRYLLNRLLQPITWWICLGVTAAILPEKAAAELFQHFDASVPGSFTQINGTLTWLDQSGNNLHAIDTSAGNGSVSLSTDSTVFPTGYDSIRFDGSNFANYGRLELLSSTASDAVLDQSGANPSGFSVLITVRGDSPVPAGTWNDLIGNTTDVLGGSFLMRYNDDNGKFQAAVGGKTVQNNFAGESNYNNGDAYVLGFNYNPAQSNSEITLTSSLNNYTESFDLSSNVIDRDFSNNDPLTLGKAFDTISRLFTGNIGEVKVYNSALTALEFAQEVDRLDEKWNASPDGRLDLIINRATGAMTLTSPGTQSIDLVGLSLKSASNSLDISDWQSVTENYDADSGTPLVDANDTWLKLNEEADDLSEATFGTSTIVAGQTIELGTAFVLGATEDIEAEYADPDTQRGLPILVRYTGQTPANLLPGDFNNDGTVDAADYVVWRSNVGNTVTLANETMSNGRVTEEDYRVWRSNYGATNSLASQASAIPEPTGLLLACIASLPFTMRRKRYSSMVCQEQSLSSSWKHFVAALASIALVLGATLSSAQALEATVGAYYYPWWGTHDWNDTLRARMAPTDQRPAIGYHDSADQDVISAHINQSHRGNISMWASSWWGPGSVEDNVLRNNILPHPRAGELKHAVHYESTGRFGDINNPNFSNLSSDFEYLADNVFADPNYYRIDNRPVVFMYVSRAYFNNPAAQQALASARQSLITTHGYDPYVVGDEIFGSTFDSSRASHFDAVTTFDVYAMSGMKFDGTTQSDIATAASKYNQAANAGATVIPGISPGYNDNREGNPATGRYFSNESIAQAGSVFTALIDQAAGPNVDSSIDNLILVNSFNEWHEDTQIEPTIITPPSAIDISPSGTAYTEGKTFEGYGNKYLDLLRAGTTEGGPTLIDGDADFDGDLDSDDIAAFVAAWGEENRIDGLIVGGYESRIARPDFNYDGVVDFQDWFVMRSAHPLAARASLSALLAVPEPTSALLITIAALLHACKRRR